MEVVVVVAGVALLTVFFLGVYVGKIFFVRKSANELLLEQNSLLKKLLEVNSVPLPLAPPTEVKVVLDKSQLLQELATTKEQQQPSESSTVIEDTPLFIPKASKPSKSDVTAEKTKSKFDAGDVEKLRSSISKKGWEGG